VAVFAVFTIIFPIEVVIFCELDELFCIVIVAGKVTTGVGKLTEPEAEEPTTMKEL
jgi:hypothetical protein